MLAKKSRKKVFKYKQTGENCKTISNMRAFQHKSVYKAVKTRGEAMLDVLNLLKTKTNVTSV